MKVTQVIKEAITVRVMAKCEEANKGYVSALNTELDRLAEERKQHFNDLTKEYHKAFHTRLSLNNYCWKNLIVIFFMKYFPFIRMYFRKRWMSSGL